MTHVGFLVMSISSNLRWVVPLSLKRLSLLLRAWNVGSATLSFNLGRRVGLTWRPFQVIKIVIKRSIALGMLIMQISDTSLLSQLNLELCNAQIVLSCRIFLSRWASVTFAATTSNI